MKFSEGDPVKLTKERRFTDGTTIPSGTEGTVEAAFPLAEDYRVRFDGGYGTRRVLEKYLEPA